MNENVMRVTWEIDTQILLYRGGDFWKKLPKSLYLKALRTETEWSYEDYLKLEKRVCIHYAASLLLRRAYTSAMLSLKLKEKFFEEESIQYTLTKLKSDGYLDDEKRIEAAIERYARQGYGPAYIQAKLQSSLKLSYETTQEMLARYCLPSLVLSACNIALKKVKTKNYIALARRGFPHEVIVEALQE